jgi:hypothetical protein
LTVAKEQAKNNKKKVKDINRLYEYKNEEFIETAKARYYKNTFDAFFKRSTINSADFVKRDKIESQNTVKNILKRLGSSGLI